MAPSTGTDFLPGSTVTRSAGRRPLETTSRGLLVDKGLRLLGEANLDLGRSGHDFSPGMKLTRFRSVTGRRRERLRDLFSIFGAVDPALSLVRTPASSSTTQGCRFLVSMM